jgi:UDP-glucose 4-epimerase
MRIVLTGGSGFLGNTVIHQLIKHDIELLVPFNRFKPRIGWNFAHKNLESAEVLCNLADPFGVNYLVQNFQPTHIIHLAGAASVRKDNPHAVIDNNIKATYNLLEACKLSKAPIDFIFSSSVLTYGNAEHVHGENDPLIPDTLYGVTKVACEQMIDLYYKRNLIRPRVLRYCGIVGKNMTHGRIHEVLQGETHIKLMGKAPGSSLPYISLQTATNAILAALEYNKPTLTCNVCSSDTLSLDDALQTVAKCTKLPLKIEYDGGNMPNGRLQCNTQKVYYELGLKMPHSSAEEIQKGLTDEY